MIGTAAPPTRTAALELREERALVREAYGFLDEKRLLLAAELLHQLADYERLAARLQAQADAARDALGDALARHGLQGLTVYPAREMEAFTLAVTRRDFMGVVVAQTAAGRGAYAGASPPLACNPSSEAQACGEAFHAMLETAVELAGVTGNLQRLLADYRLTERRARALENVILPELDRTLRDLTIRLEEQDLEDAVRVRLHASGGAAGANAPAQET